MEAKYPKDGIFLFHDVVADEECDYFIDMINKYSIKGRETYGHRENVIADSVNIIELSDPGDKKRVCDLMFEKVLKLCKNFKEVYEIETGGFVTPTLRMITGATRYHKDGVVLPKQIRGGMCPASQLRNMSIIIALNSDYQGGELCFPEHGRVIKLTKGQAVAFPPYWTHPHYTNELLNGTVRYTANLWTYEKV